MENRGSCEEIHAVNYTEGVGLDKAKDETYDKYDDSEGETHKISLAHRGHGVHFGAPFAEIVMYTPTQLL